MKYERLLNNYSLPIFLKELDEIDMQEIGVAERDNKLRFIRFVSIMFHLKLKCLRNPEYRPGEWVEVQYLNMLSFFGSRDIDECERKLRFLIRQWSKIIKRNMALNPQTFDLEVSTTLEE